VFQDTQQDGGGFTGDVVSSQDDVTAFTDAVQTDSLSGGDFVSESTSDDSTNFIQDSFDVTSGVQSSFGDVQQAEEDYSYPSPDGQFQDGQQQNSVVAEDNTGFVETSGGDVSSTFSEVTAGESVSPSSETSSTAGAGFSSTAAESSSTSGEVNSLDNAVTSEVGAPENQYIPPDEGSSVASDVIASGVVETPTVDTSAPAGDSSAPVGGVEISPPQLEVVEELAVTELVPLLGEEEVQQQLEVQQVDQAQQVEVQQVDQVQQVEVQQVDQVQQEVVSEPQPVEEVQPVAEEVQLVETQAVEQQVETQAVEQQVATPVLPEEYLPPSTDAPAIDVRAILQQRRRRLAARRRA